MLWFAVAVAAVWLVAAAVEFALELGVSHRAVSPVWVRGRVRRH